MSGLARRLFVAVLAVGGTFCAGLAPPALAGEDRGARLVLLVVVDQLTTEHLERYRPLLSGGLGRLMRQGAYYPSGRFAVANTETGPGHATIATGAWSDVHGIVGNRWVDRATGAMIRCVEDRKFGNSPQYLEVPGIADAIKLATRGRGRVVAVAHKPRAAVLVAGQRPDLVTWYERKQGRFVAGRWPGLTAPPRWFQPALLRTGPEQAVNRTWARFRSDIDYEAWSAPDDRPFEVNTPGIGRTFPRPLGSAPDRWPSVYPGTPPALADLMTFATAAITGAELGRDDAVDLLYIGIGAFDYIGHGFGADSQESLDMLLRIDAALGALQAELSTRLGGGAVLTVVTSDHGVVPIPEVAAAHGLDAKRIPPSVFTRALDDRVWAVHPPRVYLKLGRRGREPLSARRALAQKLAAQPEILRAYVPEDVEQFSEPYRTHYRRLLVAGRTPDILFLHRPMHYVSAVGADGIGQGTGHGSPYLYDQTVPVLLHGPRIRAGVDRTPVMMTRLAPTIAAALAIAPPAAARAPALPAVAP